MRFLALIYSWFHQYPYRISSFFFVLFILKFAPELLWDFLAFCLIKPYLWWNPDILLTQTNFNQLWYVVICSLLLFVPLVGIIVTMLMSYFDKSLDIIKSVSLAMFTITWVISLLLWPIYKLAYFGYTDYFFNHTYFDYLGLIKFSIGLDGLSLVFVFLTTYIFPLCLLASWETPKKNPALYIMLLFFAQFLLLGFFLTTDILFFFIFFEAILVPFLLLIGFWGSRARRVHAAYMLFYFTFFGSIWMLFGIILLIALQGTTSMSVLNSLPLISFDWQIILCLLFFVSFAIKIPVVPLHIWLPEAHTESPTAGSMLLAGLLLKLGGYGIMRIILPYFPLAWQYLSIDLLIVGIISLISIGLVTLVQSDLKKFIAYSSIAHMAYVIVGLFGDNISYLGGVLVMLAHGLSASAFFFCAGLLYDRFGTRIIALYGGLAKSMPVFATLFFILTLISAGVPGSLNFVGEIELLAGTLFSNIFVGLTFILGLAYSAWYSVWLFVRLFFGLPQTTNEITGTFDSIDINVREFYVLSSLIIPLIIFGINPGYITQIVDPVVVALYSKSLFIAI